MANSNARKGRHGLRRYGAAVKDMWRTSLTNWKRFLSIVLITMLGVAVLTGIYAGCRDTLLSADRFYDAQQLYDIQVVSSAGLTNDDVKALAAVKGVQSVQGEHAGAASVKIGGTQHLATINELGGNGLNQVAVQQGALPANAEDVAVTKRFMVDSGARLGDRVSLTSTDAATGQATAVEYTITAVVLNPTDIANPEGYSTGTFRSQQTASYEFFVPSGSTDATVYSAVSISVAAARQLDTFSDEYDSRVQTVIDRINDTATQRREESRSKELERESTLLRQAASQSDGTSSADGGASADASAAEVQWHITDRASIATFSNLKGDLSSIESIGRAFPVVFLVVAILMSLTAMTRMVEEDRGLIGTYLGLGYGRVPIASRYVVFALAACIVGGVLGNLLGFIGIPAFLMKVLEGLYVIPNTAFSFDALYGLGGFVLFAVGVVGATLLACREEMSQMPAHLMRPKSPKVGSRVLLERWRWLWKRMSFLNKVTVRNIFRFKSRLLMTIGGVAGCTALIVCGFAINDTVQTLGAKQYGGVDRYDLLSIAVSDDAASTMRQKLVDDGRVNRSVDLRVEGADLLNAAGESEAVRLIVVPDGEDIGNMVDFRPSAEGLSRTFGFSAEAGSRPRLTLGKSGLLVAQSAANAIGVRAGSVASLRSDAHGQHSVKVQQVYRNLIGSDVFMSESLYKSVFGVAARDFATNAVMATLKGGGDAQVRYAKDLEKSTAVASASSTVAMERGFSFDLMSAVVALIVALAGSLALVVLFTLSSTNVSERIREMATLKVLGFTDREVHVYVNKEMLLLAFFGTLLGLPLGRVVGGMLTGVLNMSGMFFEVEVRWSSYLISAGVTMVFALIVQLFTNVVLNRIDPVSSLKSVE
ncbi:ABC transporter permease [Bifidobacterium crudilactis]|jgi:putative ABC transport system permease protein|uniref:ABC transporter permease n=1 Tax=Bifidobacterium crudilactis TaxID=327277 RepID=UPI0023563064|nr:ABC transporter permease [Bifidobacterium crudilactis]MCI1218257.1 ABC transporter permease [Bifidobacterium crudilactis]